MRQVLDKRVKTRDIDVDWHVALGPGKRKVPDIDTSTHAIMGKLKNTKISILTEVEHPCCLIEYKIGHVQGGMLMSAKNSSVAHAVSLEQFVDGLPRSAAENTDMSEPANGYWASNEGGIAHQARFAIRLNL